MCAFFMYFQALSLTLFSLQKSFEMYANKLKKKINKNGSYTKYF